MQCARLDLTKVHGFVESLNSLLGDVLIAPVQQVIREKPAEPLAFLSSQILKHVAALESLEKEIFRKSLCLQQAADLPRGSQLGVSGVGKGL